MYAEIHTFSNPPSNPPPPHTVQMLWYEIMRVAPYQINYQSRINYPSRVNYSLSVECRGNGSGLTFMTFSSYLPPTSVFVQIFFIHILCYWFTHIYKLPRAVQVHPVCLLNIRILVTYMHLCTYYLLFPGFSPEYISVKQDLKIFLFLFNPFLPFSLEHLSNLSKGFDSRSI